MHVQRTLGDIFLEGGLVMWPLLAASVAGVAIAAERTVHFARTRLDFDRFVKEISEAVASGNMELAAEVARRSRHPIASLAGAFVSSAHLPPQQREELIRREGEVLLEDAERRLPLLRLVVQVSPLLGLLGTVQGLLLAFWQLEVLTGPVRPADVAAGIGSALITTVFGLVIAIPCSVFLLLFEERAERLGHKMGLLVSHLEEAWFSARPSQERGPDRESPR
jgi:biopolymer transport protein ExbB